MGSSYLDHYSIVQTFKENDFQKVFIGTDNRNNHAVVINTIYTEGTASIWDSVEQNYKNIFNNILHFEKIENQIVIVTKVEEGLALNAYLNNLSPSFTERVDLIYQYLNGIKQYDLLPNNAKSILVDESQIIVNNGRISFDELIIFNESSFETDNFEIVLNNIVSVLKKLTSPQNINYEELPLYIKIIGFLDEIQKNNGPYSSIHEIFNDLEKLNIVNSPIPNKQESAITSNSTNLVGRRVGSLDDEIIRQINGDKNPLFSVAIGTAGVITVVLIGLFVFKSILPLNKDIKEDPNISSNGVIDIDTNDMAENEETEDAVAENSDKEIVGPSNHVDYLSEYIEEDFATSKYSDYSYKISGENHNSHKIIINQGPIKANSQLLMWVKSDTTDGFKITIEGYSNDKLSFQQSIPHKPLFTNSWQLVQLTLDKDIKDYVNIVFENIDNTVWIDKISIDIFK